MGMNPAYEEMYREVHEVEFKVKDLLDKPNESLAQELRKELYDLHEEFEQNKNPRNIESRIKSIQQILWQTRSTPEGIMDSEHADHFWHIFEDMRLSVRRLPNY